MHFANMGKRSAMVPQCHLVERSLSVQGGSKECQISNLGRFDNKKVKKVDIFLLLIDLINLISY